MKSLNVFYEERLVGIFSIDEELVHSFEYEKEWIDSKNSFPITISMPLENKKFGNKITLSFFENLLPEGNVRTILEKWHHSEGAFNTLYKYGEDCAGALVITHKDKPPVIDESKQNIEIKLTEIYKAIDESSSIVDLIASKSPGYLSIAGAQDKFPCIYKNGKIYLPSPGLPTTHIVKIPIRIKGIKESVYNEYFCMRLANSIGLNTPNVTILKGAHPLYIIERYDRYTKNNSIRRIHQQDFCQALGVLSKNKYEAEEGPSFEQNYNLMIKQVTPNKRVDCIFSLIDWLCFNLLIGNNDSHSKNLSFVLRDRVYDLAPFYDLLSTAIYPSLENKFSFKIGGENKLEKIGQNAISLHEQTLDLKPGTIIKRMNLVYKKIVENQDSIIDSMSTEHPESKIQLRIKELILKRAKHFKRCGLNVDN